MIGIFNLLGYILLANLGMNNAALPRTLPCDCSIPFLYLSAFFFLESLFKRILLPEAQLRKLPRLIAADRTVTVDDADPNSGILARGVEIHSRKAERFTVGHPRGNDFHQRIADAIGLGVLPDEGSMDVA